MDFKRGDRVELLHTDDPYTRLRPGARGTVTGVWGPGSLFAQPETIFIDWDDGSNLSMIPESGDLIRKVV